MHNIVVLTGKPAGGTRPIALMPMLYRLWTKIRKSELDHWCSIEKGPWDAAVAGSSALRSALLTMLGDELSQLTGEEVIKILWDLEKFYDSIDIVKLITCRDRIKAYVRGRL